MGICFQNIKKEGPELMDREHLNLSNDWAWVVLRRDPVLNKQGTHDWHLQGIGADEELAVGICQDENYMIGPLPVNVALPSKIIDWVGSYFPLKK